MDVCSRVSPSCGSTSSCEGGAAPLRTSSNSATACSLPIRHGTHLPHDSLRKKRTIFVASSNRSCWSLITITAPVPNMLPAAFIASKSSGVSALFAGRKLELAPPGKNACNWCLAFIPPASSINSRTVVPMGISKTFGFAMSAIDPIMSALPPKADVNG